MRTNQAKTHNSLRPRRRSKDSIVAVCHEVENVASYLHNSLKLFRLSLTKNEDDLAINTVSELEKLSKEAYGKVVRRLCRLTGTRTPESPKKSEYLTPPNSEWRPSSWTGIHAELLTYIVRSIETCRRAIASQGMLSDHVTRLTLIQILELFEEMLWVAEMNPAPLGEFQSEVDQKGAVTGSTSCALVNSEPTKELLVIPGTLQTTPGYGSVAIFAARGASTGPNMPIRMGVLRRLIWIHPESQALFSDCANILEFSNDEFSSLSDQMKSHIRQPLLSPLAGTATDIAR